MFIRLPSPQAPNSGPSSRHYPLTPPTVAPPSVSAHTSCATKQEQCSPAKASALLSKAASTPNSPKRSTTETNLNSSSLSGKNPERPGGSAERRYSDGYEAMRCWTGHQQRDGYVSFPDFEYFTDYANYESQDPQREGIKT